MVFVQPLGFLRGQFSMGKPPATELPFLGKNPCFFNHSSLVRKTGMVFDSEAGERREFAGLSGIFAYLLRRYY